MRSLVFAVLVPLSLPVFLCAAEDEADKSDLYRLQGYWRLEAVQQNSVKPELLRLLHGIQTAKGDKPFGVLAVQGDKFAFNGKDKVARLAVGKLDAEQTLRAVGLTAKTGSAEGKTYLGIYRLQGDELTLCIAEGETRPTEFKANPNQILLRYTRIKTKQAFDPGVAAVRSRE